MPNCYLLTVATNSSLDKSTNTWSLFQLIESLILEPEEELPEGKIPVIQLEVHTFWLFSEGEIGVEYEWRIIHARKEEEIPWEKVFNLKSEKRHHRFRVQGFPVIKTGDITLRVEWRKKGDKNWNRCETFWPLTINIKVSNKT